MKNEIIDYSLKLQRLVSELETRPETSPVLS